MKLSVDQLTEFCLKHGEMLGRLTPIILILFVGLVPITWFGDNLVISFFDEDLPLPPFNNLETYQSAWYRLSPPGFALFRPLANLLYVNYFVLFNKLGIPLHILQAIYFVSFTLIAGLSMYYLILSLYRGSFARIGALITAMLYMNNPVLYHVIWTYMLAEMYPIYAVTPLILLLYIRCMRSGNILKYGAVSSAVLLCASPTGTSLVFATPIAVIFTSFIAFSVFTNMSWKKSFVDSVKYLIVFGFLSFLLQGWWVLPTVFFINRIFQISFDYRPAIGITNLDTMFTVSKTTSFVNLYQMQGHLPSYILDVGNVPWDSYSQTYFKPLFVLIGFVTPILAVFGMLNKVVGKWRIYFGGLLIFTLFIMKGAYPPFEEIYIWIFENFAISSAYRVFYQKLGLLLPFSLSVMAGFGFVMVLRQVRRLFNRFGVEVFSRPAITLISMILIGILNFWTYPYWTGELIPRPNKIRAGAKVDVPNYYSEADLWLQGQEGDFRMMILPLPRLYSAALRWEHGFWGVDPSAWLFSTPTIARVSTTANYALPVRIAELINSKEPTNSACLLGLLNVRYLMLHSDANWEYLGNNDSWWVTGPNGVSQSSLEKSLTIQPDLEFVKSIGGLYFYENAKLIPHTYAASQILHMDGGLDALVSKYDSCEVVSPPAIFLSELGPDFTDNLNKVLLAKKPGNAGSLPTISTIRFDPNQYRITVDEARAPFVLVFGESYDPDWSAEINGKAIDSHFLVNGYANAWYVEKTGTYDISIYFKPQNIVDKGFWLSGLGIILTISVYGMGYFVPLPWGKAQENDEK